MEVTGFLIGVESCLVDSSDSVSILSLLVFTLFATHIK